MIDIDKAEVVITDSVTCTMLKNEINSEGTYLLFEDVFLLNHLKVEYNFSLFVAIGLLNEDRQEIYDVLNVSLNEINSSQKIELTSCQPIKKDGELLIYQLKLKVKIIGQQ